MKPFYALKIELLCFYEGCATATAVISWPSVHHVRKPLSTQGLIVFVVSGCAAENFLFSEGEEIFIIHFFFWVSFASPFKNFVLSVELCGF